MFTVALRALVLCLAVSAPAVTREAESALWRVEPGGTLIRASLPDGTVERPPTGSLPPLSAVAGPAGDRLYALSPSTDGRATALLAITLPSLEITSRWELRGAADQVRVSPAGDLACVTMTRPGGGWSLVVVDLLQGQVKPGVQLAYEPQTMAIVPDGTAPHGVRLVIAAQDRLATFTLDPPSPSWFYRSPGKHHAVAHLPTAEAGSLVVLRDESLVVIDPARRVKVEGRTRLTDDDATSIVPLPAAGQQLMVRPAPEMAVVLLGGGQSVAWVDLESGRVRETRDLPSPREMVDGGEAVFLAGLQESAGHLPFERMDPPERLPEPAPVPIAPGAVASPPAEQPSPLPPPEPAPSSPPPVPSPSAPGPERKAPEPEPAPALPEPSGPVLSGRLTGAAGLAMEVRLFGPNNILKLHARIPVSADGTWRAPIPPPGSYRVVVGAAPGTHVFTRPELRTIVVGSGGAPVEGIDFEVRGGL
ncbi:MAG: YncE family protein [Candidatus Polarisedimenticolia bacterium]